MEQLLRREARPHVRERVELANVGISHVARLGASPSALGVSAPLVDRAGKHRAELVKPDLLGLSIESGDDLKQREAAPDSRDGLLHELIEAASQILEEVGPDELGLL